MLLASSQVFFSNHTDPVPSASIISIVKVHFLPKSQALTCLDVVKKAPNGKDTVVTRPGFVW